MDQIKLVPQCEFFYPKCTSKCTSKCKPAFETNDNEFAEFIKKETEDFGKSIDDVIGNFKVIDMTYPRFPFNDPNIVTRFCASPLLIPKEAFNIMPIWGSTGLNELDNFNKDTGLDYGFSYKIRKEYDICFKMRKIEKDMILDRIIPQNNTYEEHLVSYDNFVNYYNDEVFPEPDTKDAESVDEPSISLQIIDIDEDDLFIDLI